MCFKLFIVVVVAQITRFILFSSNQPSGLHFEYAKGYPSLG